MRIMEAENRIQQIEEAAMKLSEAHDELEAKLIGLEGRTRRENIRLHGIAEGSEDSSPSISTYIENLPRDKFRHSDISRPREKKIKFQTPFPAKLRVFYENDTCVYNFTAEATKDMMSRCHHHPTIYNVGGQNQECDVGQVWKDG
ncbi:hypothetical protein XENOCAPTIV_023648 [Xenoophorus captivus]|uniref:Uncharacterized protein n=1 Tax=Xenoophorus captivus TaxID=1517983 RepID=A0ABV0S9Q6_9TELE